MFSMDIETLRQRLAYDPQTGALIRLSFHPNATRTTCAIGSRADIPGSRGYRGVSLEGKFVRAHRVCWALAHGEWPAGEIDHINGDPADNRITNLRLCVRRQNGKNLAVQKRNRSGYKGVVRDKARGKWLARVVADYQVHNLGRFDTPEEAATAYNAAAAKLHGEFGRLNPVGGIYVPDGGA